jgi:hypothetical protein
MMAMTTNNSMSVNPGLDGVRFDPAKEEAPPESHAPKLRFIPQLFTKFIMITVIYQGSDYVFTAS